MRHPNSLAWGALVGYSLPYLQASVKDLGLPSPLDGMVALAELDLRTALDRGQSGRTTGTMNLGAVWIGNWVQTVDECPELEISMVRSLMAIMATMRP